MLSWIVKKIIGSKNQREIRRMTPLVEKINEIEVSYQKLTEEQLKAKTGEFKERFKKGETLDDLLPEAFAVVKNACRRLVGQKISVVDHELTWDMIPYNVQLIGGMVLHKGRISEMATGEGKTLVATMPLYLNALSGENVHLVTANDYLARRDSEWMGTIYKYLGLTVGCIQHNISATSPMARTANSASITSAIMEWPPAWKTRCSAAITSPSSTKLTPF
jgi:preprotein translocase subunit SecA